jgi:hypothetical protein
MASLNILYKVYLYKSSVYVSNEVIHFNMAFFTFGYLFSCIKSDIFCP